MNNVWCYSLYLKYVNKQTYWTIIKKYNITVLREHGVNLQIKFVFSIQYLQSFYQCFRYTSNKYFVMKRKRQKKYIAASELDRERLSEMKTKCGSQLWLKWLGAFECTGLRGGLGGGVKVALTESELTAI